MSVLILFSINRRKIIIQVNYFFILCTVLTPFPASIATFLIA